MGGSYSQSGNVLTVGPLAATRMFCPDPAMSFENQGGAILAQPVTISSSGDRMTLTNSVGRIDLRRTY